MEALFASVTVPTWAVVAGTLALFLLLVLWLRSRTGAGDAFASFAQLALVLVVGSLGFFGLRYLDDEARNNDRHAFAQRASALVAQTSQSGMLSCVDGSTNEMLNEACEKILFTESPRTAAALALTRQRLAFIADAINYSAGRDLPLNDQIENLRAATEADPFGFVAQVLSEKDNCTPEACARFALLRDPSHVQENLKEKKFEALLAKHLSKAVEMPKSASPINSAVEPSGANAATSALEPPTTQNTGVRAPVTDAEAHATNSTQPSTAPIPQARPKQKSITATVTPAGAARGPAPVQAIPAAQSAPTVPPPASFGTR